MITSPADTLVCDTAQIAAWQADPSYDYNRELITPELNVLEWINKKLTEFFHLIFHNHFVDQYSELLLIGIVLVILLLLIWFIYKKRPELFMRTRKNQLAYSVSEDTIYGIDFIRGIDDSLASSNYREAVRLLYLQTLKQLSDERRIEWQLYKTPTQYIYEVRIAAFRDLTNHFLRVRYGNFEATEALFRKMQALQGELSKGGVV